MNPWKGTDSLSKSQIIELQSSKLCKFINNYVYPFSPHYKSVFDSNKINPTSIKSVADLARIPFTSKLDFINKDEPQKFKNFVLQPTPEKIKQHWPLSKKLNLLSQTVVKGKARLKFNLEREFKPTLMTFTTGTTNRPVPFVYSNYDINNLYTSGARMLDLFDVDSNDTIVNMFPYAPHLAFWQVVFGGFAANMLALSTGGGKVMGTDGNISVIDRLKPALILGVPSYVYHVLREAHARGEDMSSVKKVVLGASRVTMGLKQKLADLLTSMGASDVSVMGTYGFTEARCAWGECPTKIGVSSGYHLYADHEIFEIVDPKTGEVKAEGEDGELVYTSLDARGSVVLRYRTGDFVRGGITYEPCPHCERSTPRISSDITRLSDVKDLQLSKVKGALVNLNTFASLLSDIPQIEEWQLEIRKKNNDPYECDEVAVYVTEKAGVNSEDLKQEIVKQMIVATEISPNEVCFIKLDEMVKRLGLETENKEKRILDKRPKDS